MQSLLNSSHVEPAVPFKPECMKQLLTQLGNKSQGWKPSAIVLLGEVLSTAWESSCPQWRVILTFKAMPLPS